MNGTAKKVLDKDILQLFFRSLNLPEATMMDCGHISERDLIKRLGERNIYEFLAIMIFTTCTIEASRKFTSELLVNNSWTRDMFKLPVGREQLRELFEEDITPDKFLAHQACFCPVTITKGQEYRIEIPERERLPCLEETLKAKGSKKSFMDPVYVIKLPSLASQDPVWC